MRNSIVTNECDFHQRELVFLFTFFLLIDEFRTNIERTFLELRIPYNKLNKTKTEHTDMNLYCYYFK